ncbi:T3SS effector HopA1 family protein [Coleofasciculus sp.]|uniref:T3SS effector HopA1 family protein n=1 Tax=Coleofasciculus sp. TaxID=3100458 RepID=UPI003A2C261E
MQLLNIPTLQPTNSLLDTLQDIANTIELQANFCIHHPNYKPFELPEEIINRLQNMPSDIQQRYWSLQLRGFLYGIYYNQSLENSLALNTDNPAIPLDLENNTLLGLDLNFYQQLHNHNQGTGYFDPGWFVLKQETDNTIVVSKGSLKLHIEPQRHLHPNQPAAIGDTVAIRMPKNLIQNGFYMAVSNAGSQAEPTLDHPSETVRIYFNLTPDGAVSVMDSLTQQFNAINLPFTFKVLYNPADYERYDSGVFYFDKPNYPTVRQVLQVIYEENQAHFKPQVPLFTKVLAPGLGLAEEPDTKFGTQESFGMNRCQLVANGLLEAWQNGDNSPDGRMQAILQQFSLFGIDINRAYLNANSDDNYTPLLSS